MNVQSCCPLYSIISDGCQTELIENGILVYKGAFLKSSVSIAHGDQLIISCKNGYKMSEKAEIICHLGKWSSPFPHCKPGEIIKIFLFIFKSVFNTNVVLFKAGFPAALFLLSSCFIHIWTATQSFDSCGKYIHHLRFRR